MSEDNDNSELPELRELRDALDALESASKIPTRQRSIQVTPIVDELSELAFQLGLQDPELRRVIDLITIKTFLDQTSITTLIKNLYPAERVPSDVVIAVVGALGHGKHKPSAASQAALVRWLTLVRDVLQETTTLDQLYGVLFDLLDMISLRAPLCQLLASLTRRKHVKHFRIQRLLELCQQAGTEQPLLALLLVYKNYYPDIIIGAPVSSRALSLASSIEWKNRLLAIQNATAQLSNGSRADYNGFHVRRDSSRRTKSALLPEVHTFHPREAAVTLEEVRTVDDFVDNIERLEPPSQAIAGLKDPLLQKYILLNPSGDAAKRMDFWLLRYFEEELETLREGFGLSPTLTEMLSALASYTEATKQLSPIVQKFFEDYLPFWDGASNLGSILDIIAYVPPQPFSPLLKTVLNTLEKAVCAGSYEGFGVVMDFYSGMASRWIHQLATEQPSNPLQGQEVQAQVFVDLFCRGATVAWCSITENDKALTSIANFYRTVAASLLDVMREGGRPIPVMIPPPEIVYRLVMSTDLAVQSAIYSALATYKELLELEAKQARKDATDNTRAFNGFLMDVCNLVWRSRALVATDTNATGCLYPAANLKELQTYLNSVDPDYHPAIMFGLSHNPATSSVAKAAFAAAIRERTTSGEAPHLHEGPVAQRSLAVWAQESGVDLSWKDYRSAVLEYLDARDCGGAKDLMFMTMKDLMQ